MRKLLLLVGFAALVAAMAVPTSGLAAKPTKFHDNFDDTFTVADFCGIAVTGHAVGVDNFVVLTVDANGDPLSFKDTSSVKVTYTAANGKSIVVSSAGQHTGSATTNQDGSVTFFDTYKGLPEKIFTPQGPVLTRDAGIISFATTFAANGDFVSQVVTQSGPHPEADADFALFCQIVTPLLS